ncbi:MAG: cellulase family glycosylhydrolase [Planctomycetes bacterium]|nr:cellulase family glycosylhydrolase [Planctomycetota bacterium]
MTTSPTTRRRDVWRCVLAMTVLVGTPLGAAVELTQLTNAPCADDLVTWQVAGGPAEWNVLDVEHLPRLVVTSPSGRTWTRPAFLDQDFTAPDAAASTPPAPHGAPMLRIRHAPRVAGVHGWKLLGPDGAELAQGQLSVAPARTAGAHVGPLQIARDNLRLLGFRDGAVFIPIGPNLCWANAPDQLGGFARWFAALHAAGATHVRLWFAGWCGGLEGAQPDAYRLDQAWLMDRILDLARGAGIKVTLVLDNHHDLKHGTLPYGGDFNARVKTFFTVPPPAQYERRLRYVLARWGSDDTVAAWELYNEVDLAQGDRDAALKWATGAAALLARLDQDHRPRTISWSADDWDQVAAVPDIDLIQIHSYVLEWSDPIGLLKQGHHDGVAMLCDNARRANDLAKPFCFAELGYQGSNEKNPGNDLDTAGLLMRQQLWAGFLLGGYGGGMDWWWDTHLDKAKLWDVYRGLATAVARVDWHDKELAPLQPNAGSSLRIIGWQSPRQALLWPQIRSDTWYRHLVEGKPRPQLVRALPFRLGGFKAGTAFRVHALDQVSGDEQGVATATSSAQGELEIVAPAPGRDTVLWVEDGAK